MPLPRVHGRLGGSRLRPTLVSFEFVSNGDTFECVCAGSPEGGDRAEQELRPGIRAYCRMAGVSGGAVEAGAVSMLWEGWGQQEGTAALGFVSARATHGVAFGVPPFQRY